MNLRRGEHKHSEHSNHPVSVPFSSQWLANRTQPVRGHLGVLSRCLEQHKNRTSCYSVIQANSELCGLCGLHIFSPRKLPTGLFRCRPKLQWLLVLWISSVESHQNYLLSLMSLPGFVCHHWQDSPSATPEASDFGDGEGFSHLQVSRHADRHLPHGEFHKRTMKELLLASPLSPGSLT